MMCSISILKLNVYVAFLRKPGGKVENDLVSSKI